MKLEKWIEKMGRKAETLSNGKGLVFCNADEGLYFAPKTGTHAYFLPDMRLVSAAWDKKNECERGTSLPLYFQEAGKDSTIASARDGFLPSPFQSGRGRNVSVFTNEKGVSAVVDKKLLRDFPKNTLFYVSSRIRPVLAGIWENGVLNVIGIVCPINAPADAVRFEDQGAAAAD